MNCKKCGANHDGSYGSGMFCNVKCKNSFTSMVNREETNKKVSQTMKRLIAEGKAKPPNVTLESQQKAVQSVKATYQKLFNEASWEDLSAAQKGRRLKEEQKNCCWMCGIKDWMQKPINLEFHHVNGNRKNENRTNCILLCPNCHSQTPNFRGKNKSKRNRNQIKDQEIINAVKSVANIRQLLQKLNLTPKGKNYETIRKRMEKLRISF